MKITKWNDRTIAAAEEFLRALYGLDGGLVYWMGDGEFRIDVSPYSHRIVRLSLVQGREIIDDSAGLAAELRPE